MWLAEVEDDASKVTPETYSTLRWWAHEMSECTKVDPENKSRYDNTVDEVYVERLMRAEDFLDRHGLWKQFLDEDEVIVRKAR